MIILRILLKSNAVQFCAIAASLAVLLISVGFEDGLSKSDWSSWVMAVGSIAAILAAFLVADRQLAKARQVDAIRNAEEMTRKAHILNAILFNISSIGFALDKAGNDGDGEFLRDFDAAALAHQASLLRSIPPFYIPTAGIIYAITDLPQKLNALQNCITTGQRSANFEPSMCLFYMLADGFKQKTLCVISTSLEAMKQCREVIPELR